MAYSSCEGKKQPGQAMDDTAEKIESEMKLVVNPLPDEKLNAVKALGGVTSQSSLDITPDLMCDEIQRKKHLQRSHSWPFSASVKDINSDTFIHDGGTLDFKDDSESTVPQFDKACNISSDTERGNENKSRRTSWHDGMLCKTLRKSALRLQKWAKKKNKGIQHRCTWEWRLWECPQCNVFIQQLSGHDTCTQCWNHFHRCGDRLCYVHPLLHYPQCGIPILHASDGSTYIGHNPQCGDHFCLRCGDHLNWGHNLRYNIYGCKFIFRPENPVKRRVIRGAVTGICLLAMPLWVGLAVCSFVPSLIIIISLDRYDEWKQRKDNRKRREEREQQNRLFALQNPSGFRHYSTRSTYQIGEDEIEVAYP